MTDILIYTNKDVNNLNVWNGHDLRLIKLLEYSQNIDITNNLSKVSKSECEIVIDIPGLSIFEYFKICFFSRKIIRKVFLQDSAFRYAFTKLKHIFKYKRFDLLTIKYVLNSFRTIFREFFFYATCNKIGLVNEVDSIFNSKCVISKNGTSVKARLENKKNKENRLVFWGNINYEPNIESVISFVTKYKKFFKENNLHLFGRVSQNISQKIERLNRDGILVIIHGEYCNLEDVIYTNDIFFNCVDFGSGIKNKTIECIQLGIRQLATNHSLEGIIVRDSPVVIIDNNVNIYELYNTIKCMEPGLNSKDLEYNNISWESAAKSYENFGE